MTVQDRRWPYIETAVSSVFPFSCNAASERTDTIKEGGIVLTLDGVINLVLRAYFPAPLTLFTSILLLLLVLL